MINLTSSSHELIVVLTGVASGSPPNECHCLASYRETTDTTYSFGGANCYTNGTTDQILVGGSSVASTIRAIDHISIYQPDITGEVTVKLWDGTNELILVKQTLTAKKTLTYNDKQGWGLS